MSSMQCLPRLLFSISLLLSITISASSPAVPSLPAPNSGHKYYKNSTATTEISPREITPMISPSPTQDNSIDMVTTDSTDTATTNSTDMATTNSIDMATTNSIDMATTNSTDMTTTNSTDLATTNSATTVLPLTTEVSQTIELTSTAMTSKTQLTPSLSSISVPTSQSAQTTVTTMSASIPTEMINNTGNFKTPGPQLSLSHSEASMTIFFSLMLGLTILSIAGYSIHRCKQKKSQYIHQPLHNSSEERGDRLSAPEDTLVISGGLYDGPEIFNSADEDMGFHSDLPAFAPQPTQFRLEFLPEAQPKAPDSEVPTFETFQPFDAKD